MNNHKIIKPEKNGNGAGKDRKVPKAFDRVKKPEAEPAMVRKPPSDLKEEGLMHGVVGAIRAENAGALRELIDAGADVNAEDGSGKTMLMDACMHKHGDEIVRLLLDNGADANARDEDGWTSLMYAVKGGHAEVVKMLLDAGADANARDEDGWTSLMYAVKGGHAEVVKMLLDAGADVNAGGGTALMHAAGGGHAEVVKMLLDAGADANARDRHRLTALMCASWNGDTEVLELLINAGANVNVKDKLGKTALIIAAERLQFEIIPVLIDAGANVNTRHRFGRNALLEVIAHNTTDTSATVQLLIDSGSRINIKEEEYGWTALIIATFQNDGSMVETLLAEGADTYLRDNDGRTAMEHAKDKIRHINMKRGLYQCADRLENDFREIVRMLHDAREGRLPIVRELLDKELANTLKNAEDANSIELQRRVRRLLKAGANANAVTENGETVLMIAESTGDAKIIKMLKDAIKKSEA